jgi:hypothetical protein
MHAPLSLLLALGLGACAAAYKPCHMPYTPFTQSVESPCFATVGRPLSHGVRVRLYDAAHDNGATLVSSNVSAALQPWQNGLEVSVNHLFNYFTGNGNAAGADLTSAMTAPLMFRPARGTTASDQPWAAEMVLQPSVWPTKSTPPSPARGFVELAAFGPLQVAVLHQRFQAPPAQSDFEACDAQLRKVVAASGQWTVDAEDPRTPTFAFYFPRDDMPPVPKGPFDIECWAVVAAAE